MHLQRNVVAWFSVILVSLLFLSTPSQAAQSEAPLVYAGFAFAGDYSNRQQLFPISAQIAQEDDGKYLDNILRGKLAALPDLASRVSLELASTGLDVSSLAFALANESVEVQRVEGKVWVVLTLQANVLAFNRKTSSIVASYPVRMRVTRVRAAAPNDDEIKAIVREAYTTADPHENIFDQWLDRFQQVNLRPGAIRYLRVVDVSVTPEAEKTIVQSGRSAVAVRNQVATFLEAAIGEAAHVSLVPSSVGQAIGNKMAYRFASGEALQLSLPEPDFPLRFAIRGFAAKSIEKPEYFQDIYRVRAAISLTQPQLEKVYLDENIYGTQIVTRPRNAQVEVDAWAQYYKTLQALVTGLSRNMAKVDDAWLADNATRAAEAKNGFLNTNKLFQELK
jgi:hypothetical protein